MPKLVQKTFPSPRQITPAQRRRLEKLAAMPDSKIDLSDLPEATDDFWRRARRRARSRRNRVVVPKERITLELDSDVAAWLRSMGKGYPQFLNDALRQAMLDPLSK